jgi:hypothetical protein
MTFSSSFLLGGGGGGGGGVGGARVAWNKLEFACSSRNLFPGDLWLPPLVDHDHRVKMTLIVTPSQLFGLLMYYIHTVCDMQ